MQPQFDYTLDLCSYAMTITLERFTVDIHILLYVLHVLHMYVQLAGNFMKNTQNMAIRIKISDIKLSLSADVVSYNCDHVHMHLLKLFYYLTCILHV